MKRPPAAGAFFALLLLAAPIAAARPSLADQQAQFARSTTRLDIAFGTGARRQQFATGRRIHADLDQRVFGTWLAAIVPNGLRDVATGTSAQGALVNRQRPLPGEFSPALAPASATRLDVTMAHPLINAVADRLTITGNLTAEAYARVRASSLNTDEIVGYRARPPVRERGTATFNPGAGAGGRYPFTLRLASPDNL